MGTGRPLHFGLMLDQEEKGEKYIDDTCRPPAEAWADPIIASDDGVFCFFW